MTDKLPVEAFESQIIETVRGHQVTILAADTGAGKSTMVPLMLLRPYREDAVLSVEYFMTDLAEEEKDAEHLRKFRAWALAKAPEIPEPKTECCVFCKIPRPLSGDSFKLVDV